MACTTGGRIYFILLLCFAVLQGQRISKKKCSEYREQTINRAQFVFLLPGSKPFTIERFNCSKTVNLIYGGENAKPGEFPHQALLGWRTENPSEYEFRCGGSLISERYVLTAAHCFKRGNPRIVRLGEDNLKTFSQNQDDYEIEQIIRYPKYKFARSYDDIALIKLTEDVTFSMFVRPACLWDEPALNVSKVIATGFGQTEDGDINSETLRKVQLEFFATADCEKQYSGVREFNQGVSENQLCVGSRRGELDTCQGDSGGPIQVITEPEGCTYHVLGITSVGAACGIGSSVYTRVAGYIDWIEGIVWA